MDSIEFAGMAEYTQLACTRFLVESTMQIQDVSDTSNVDTSNVVCNPFI